MKNHIDMLIFHMPICGGASQIAMIAEQKLHSQLSVRRTYATLQNERLT